MPSCIASSFSHGEAFISSKPERTTTLTSSPPSRRAERQQSMAVLPPPSTITRLPISATWPNETLDKPIDANVDIVRGLLAAGNVEIAAARGAGTDEYRVIAFGQQRLQAVDAHAAAELDAEIRARSRTSSSITASGRRNFGIWVRIMPPAMRRPGQISPPRTRAARDRAPQSARRDRRQSAQPVCRF